mmetsp:Transcript_23502/g.42388  ORF Transcript_23502/g.42388 Transcript_23502/m.42388 type:complete len:277 (-) Transcript_23502:12-842(-)
MARWRLCAASYSLVQGFTQLPGKTCRRVRMPWMPFCSRGFGDVYQLPAGWEQFYSSEHHRAYYWHAASRTSQWTHPVAAAGASPEAAAKASDAPQSLPSGWEAVYSEARGCYYFWEKATGVTQWTPPELPEQAAHVLGNSLPDGWQAVYSDAHGCDYYWHQPSGRTSWELPVRSVSEGSRYSLEALLQGWRPLLHGAALGEELKGKDFELVRELLNYHPEVTQKLGSGVRALKVDEAPPPNSEARCFWALRTDGSSEDFSARKCVRAIQDLRRNCL